MKSKEYFKFVVSKIEKDLKIYSASSELLKCMYLLEVLKNSDNLLKDIYAISRVRNFKPLGNYLLFILKKTETGEVKFDNLIENLNSDKKFILGELMTRFRLDGQPKEAAEQEEKKKAKPEESTEEKITVEIKKILAESKFKVEEIDNELVTEEFIETEVKEDDELIVRGNYLELLQPDGAFEEDSVFSLPTDKREEEVDFIENDVFALPGEKTETKPAEEAEEKEPEPVNTEELEEVKLDKIQEEEQEEIHEEIKEEEITEVIEEDKGEVTKESVVTEKAETKEEEIPEELIPEEEFENENVVFREQVPLDDILEDEPKEEKPEEVKINEEEKLAEETAEEVKEEPAEAVREEKTTEEKPEEISVKEEAEEFAEAENSVYMQYETELMERNELILMLFDDLKSLDKEQEGFEEKRDDIVKEIVEYSGYLEDYSRKMSFEVITGVYNVMNVTFASFGRTVGGEILSLFRNSIMLVESLIKGEDFAGFDSVIKSLDSLKTTLLENKKTEIKEEPKQKEEIAEEEELPPAEKYLDTNQRQKLAVLKQNIMDVEGVFQSLEEIKGKYQSYEALRRLSHTFTHFKELVSLANMLDMRKLAQLGEASYIFVKFVQNYRMDPFDAEISEVFKYIIYNFKLIFLDKPTKDIDLLISYLNDPVKIFEKKEKK